MVAYRMFETLHGERGGVMTGGGPDAKSSSWLFYFNVEGAEAAAERVRSRGGKIVNDVHQVPSGEWIVQAIDPQGARFALMSPKRRDEAPRPGGVRGAAAPAWAI